jgi:hypothetical protein
VNGAGSSLARPSWGTSSDDDEGRFRVGQPEACRYVVWPCQSNNELDGLVGELPVAYLKTFPRARETSSQPRRSSWDRVNRNLGVNITLGAWRTVELFGDGKSPPTEVPSQTPASQLDTFEQGMGFANFGGGGPGGAMTDTAGPLRVRARPTRRVNRPYRTRLARAPGQRYAQIPFVVRSPLPVMSSFVRRDPSRSTLLPVRVVHRRAPISGVVTRLGQSPNAGFKASS